MFYACVISLCVLVLIALPATGSYKINGHAVSRAVFFATEWPLYTIVIIGAAIVVIIAYALWKELPWSREAIMAFTLLDAISVLVVVVWKGTKYDMVPGCLFAVFLAVGVAWYFYGKRTVVTYYRAVREKHAART